MLLQGAQLVGGLILLYVGAEWLVKGAAGLARSFGVPALIVGLTVVGYGTSAPEMTVSVIAAFRGSSAIALGNVVGSNVANLGLILGLTALIAPPSTDGTLVKRELPLLLVTCALLPLALWDGVISRFEGLSLLGIAAAFTAWLVRDGRRSPPGEEAAATMEQAAEAAGAPPGERRAWLVFYAVAGLALLVLGGETFVRGAVGVARRFAIEDRVVGLTVVAVGTSLPELATSLVAAKRGHSDLALGNVVGSNLYNVLLVLGATAAIRPVEGQLAAFQLEILVMIAMTLVGAVAMRTRRTLSRWEGAVLLSSYVAFLAALVVRR
ncbi:MAG: calcium/sodium antiporter [Deltaproteobacteria bacterium]|nr:calcium/sodium antiporter [Deltaproteobacteria bacterium]